MVYNNITPHQLLNKKDEKIDWKVKKGLLNPQFNFSMFNYIRKKSVQQDTSFYTC